MNSFEKRYRRMDEYLKRWRDLAKSNPNCSFESEHIRNVIYKDLTRFGVNEFEKQYDLASEGVFDKWISRFQNTPNINVFVANDWRYFCQFTNKKECFYDLARPDAIKIYIPLNRTHIEEGANLIFNFLAENDIAHQSKIGKHIRFDNIVIRLSNEVDARNLLRFVNNQKYIQEGLIESNPFAYSFKNIALACDRNLSYNETIRSLIALYISKRKVENKLDDVKLSDFIRFVGEYQNERFIKFENIEQTIQDFQIKEKRYNDYETNCTLINLKEIINLFLHSTNFMFNINTYFKHYNDTSNPMQFRKQVSLLTMLREEKLQEILSEQKLKQQIIDELIIELIDTMEKPNEEIYAINIILAYLESNNELYITSTNNLRQKMVANNFCEELKNILTMNDESLETYYSNLYQKMQEKILEHAIITTYNKYQQKYEKHEENIDGFDWTKGALLLLLEDECYDGFTRDENARSKLKKFLTSKDAIEIMRRKTNWQGSNLTNISNVEKRILSEDYLRQILQEKEIRKSHVVA